VLWGALRDRRLDGLKFRRQHPIGPLVADFCCPDRRLIIEVDGSVHETQADHDAERERLLVAAGYRVLRLRNETVLNELPTALAQIRAAALALPPVPPPERSRTRGW
jgi:5-methyltetrahydrofolate--homocysteine methyltransferase